MSKPAPDEFEGTLVSLEEGDVLSGRYHLVRQIGQGGMGVVWLAEDTRLEGRQVALKLLPTVLGRSPRAVARLKKEAATCLDLTHPHIVRLYNFEVDPARGDTAYLVMQYVQGTTLDDMLASHIDGLPLDRVTKWAGQIAEALDFAHRKGVLHRDLKPSNIMIDADDDAYLMDFGIAREAKDTMTRVTGRDSSGTLPYMSPQHLRGENHKSNDIYSFAATLYEALRGEPPFTTGDLPEQIKYVQPGPIPGQPAHVNEVLASALAKEKQDRPASAGALAARLRGAEPVGAPAPKAKPPPPPPTPRAAKRPARAGLRLRAVLTVLIILTIGLAATAFVLDQTGVFPWISALGGGGGGGGGEPDPTPSPIHDPVKGEPITDEPAEDDQSHIIVIDLDESDPYELDVSGMGRPVWDETADEPDDVTNPFWEALPDDHEVEADAPDHDPVKGDPTSEDHWFEEEFAEDPGAAFGDVFSNSVGMVLVYIEPGSFMMGSPRGEDDRDDDEHRREVTLTKGYYLAVAEVTQQQWREVMGEKSDPSTFYGGDRPVDSVTWHDAVRFCEKLSRREGLTYRLPTEAEWEYACRAGTTTPYAFGNRLSTEQANHADDFDEKSGNYRAETTPVGMFEPNDWGLHDMHGNVAEWCSDWYGEEAYLFTPSENPIGFWSGELRVVRGGSWNDSPEHCRSAERAAFAPGYVVSYLGFRVVAEP